MVVAGAIGVVTGLKSPSVVVRVAVRSVFHFHFFGFLVVDEAEFGLMGAGWNCQGNSELLGRSVIHHHRIKIPSAGLRLGGHDWWTAMATKGKVFDVC